MFKILWIAPHSLHDLAHKSATQTRSMIDFLVAMGVQVRVISLATFNQPRPEYIDPDIFTKPTEDGNTFTVGKVQFTYANAASTELGKLTSQEQRGYFGLFCKVVKSFKPDAVFTSESDLLSSNLLLDARNCGIPTVFVLQGEVYPSFRFELIDLILSTDPSLAQKYVAPQGRTAVNIGPWCHDVLVSSSTSTTHSAPNNAASASQLQRAQGPIMEALTKLNQQALEQQLSADTYQARLAEIEQQVSTGRLFAQDGTEAAPPAQPDQPATTTYEVLVPQLGFPYAIAQVLRLVLAAATEPKLKDVHFTLHEDFAGQLQNLYQQVMGFTNQMLQQKPALQSLDPQLKPLCAVSYAEFLQQPQVQVITGTAKLNQALRTAHLYLDLSVVKDSIDFGVSKALGFGVPVLTTEVKQLPEQLLADDAIAFAALPQFSQEMPGLLGLASDQQPLVELIYALKQNEQTQSRLRCLRALSRTESLEGALRGYFAILPYLERKAGQHPQLWHRSMYDVDKILKRKA